MKTADKAKIGATETEKQRVIVLKQCEKVGLTTNKTLTRIAEGLDALENKIFYDKDRGKCITGPDMITWAARLKAIDQAISILDLKPPEKNELSGNITINSELSPEVQDIFNKIYGKNDKKRRAPKL
jgi:hypothetical protein